MTIGHELRMVGVREARDNLRIIVEQVGQGAPVGIMIHSQPLAVLLRVDEAEMWRRMEHGLSALHGLEIYPELARDTSELAALIRGEVRTSLAALHTRGTAAQRDPGQHAIHRPDRAAPRVGRGARRPTDGR